MLGKGGLCVGSGEVAGLIDLLLGIVVDVHMAPPIVVGNGSGLSVPSTLSYDEYA